MNAISKQLACQKFIYKISSSRLRKEKWKLTLPIDEARKNDEIIALADSQVLRWIDELNGIKDSDETARRIKSEIRAIKKEENSLKNKKRLKQLYEELDDTQFKPDYMCLIIEKKSDYHRACKGFSINGIKYKRLLGTNGGIKNSTIVFVSEKVHAELDRRINNDRNIEKELVPAKLEAYKALSCSASNPVSLPKGIAVVNDVETEFFSDIVYLSNEGGDEPLMEERKNELIKLNASDGFGIMLPSLAERWSEELGLDYIVSGINTRFAFEKGMVYTFDFLEFASVVAKNYIIKDAWGNDVDIRNIELILTTSMVKLWDSYKNCDDYLQASLKNGYSFGITKTCPKELENERNLNYQFIQSYDLTDEDIDDLVNPTIDEIQDILGGDWRKTILFLKGMGLNEDNVLNLPDDYIKGLMIDQRLLDDPFVQKHIFQLIKNRIDEAKIGVIKVHGNYSMISGDPFLLCQNIFGLEKTGLLKAGEIYNKYWVDTDNDEVICFRAPMTCHNNIKKLSVRRGDDVEYWYRYMTTCTILNGWDTTTAALNGADFDGDLVMLTDNPVLLRKHKALPSLLCSQKNASKKKPTEEDLIKSNIDSFGNEIGQTTNWVTSMFDVRAGFSPGSEEYEVLTYRIMCGQLFQQDVIDKAKGIIAKPMPKYWYNYHEINKMEDSHYKELCDRIVASKKPYFMIYIYPELMRKYKEFIKAVSKKCIRDFNLSLDELTEIPEEELTSQQKDFLEYIKYKTPVGLNDCNLNKICKKIEGIFDGYIRKTSSNNSFDYSILKSGEEYPESLRRAVQKTYDKYNQQLKEFKVFANYERIDKFSANMNFNKKNEWFLEECSLICPNAKMLCDIALDISYKKETTKTFAWALFGTDIIRNLINNSDKIYFPTLDKNGDITYRGERFSIKSVNLKRGNNIDNT